MSNDISDILFQTTQSIYQIPKFNQLDAVTYNPYSFIPNHILGFTHTNQKRHTNLPRKVKNED